MLERSTGDIVTGLFGRGHISATRHPSQRPDFSLSLFRSPPPLHAEFDDARSVGGSQNSVRAARRIEPLQKWRVRRVVHFVDAHLGDRITLEKMAAAAERTSMYFAAQFRMATGIRPREYVLLRRTDRACELLRDTHLPLIQIALSVGFRTQAHFTAVFKRFAGDTPNRWRRRERRQAGAEQAS